MPARSITIFDIAEEAGVSIATVSRALGEQYNPRSAKHRRVREVAGRYNYLPSAAARSLGSGETRLLCIVLPEMTNPYYTDLFNRAELEASEHGYSLMMQRLRREPDSYERLMDQLITRRPDGLILAGGFSENPQTPGKVRTLTQLSQYMPTVIVGHTVEGFAGVCIDCNLAECARKLVQHLVTLGHRRIAMIGASPVRENPREREYGYAEAMRGNGLSPWFEERRTPGYAVEDGAVGVLRVLAGLAREAWPTALIAANDLTALGALRQLDKMGVRVPEEIAVVGCDNQFFTPYTHPPLTTMDLNLEEQAKLAVQYLLAPQAGMSFLHEVDGSLIVRESCGMGLGVRELG